MRDMASFIHDPFPNIGLAKAAICLVLNKNAA